jgi:hypothetical protein
MRSLVLVAMLAGGCANLSGAPLTGSISATFNGASFSPEYGIARPLVPPKYAHGTMEVQLSEAPVNCDHYAGTTSFAGDGLYIRLVLPGPVTGDYKDRELTVEDWQTANHLSTPRMSIESGSASGTISVVDTQHVVGTVMWDAMGSTVSAQVMGNFDVARCP